MSPADFLITGGGDLDPSWLPDANALLAAWISSVEAANPNASTNTIRACVYARAYRYVFDNAALAPTTQRDRDKTASWSPVLLQVISDRASQWESRCRADSGVGFAGPSVGAWEGSKCCEG